MPSSADLHKISQQEFDNTLSLHQSWLKDKNTGQKANLSKVDYAFFTAYWPGLDLSEANLREANLPEASLY